MAVLGAAGHDELGPLAGADASSRVPYARWDAGSARITGDGTMAAQVRRATLPGLPGGHLGDCVSLPFYAVPASRTPLHAGPSPLTVATPPMRPAVQFGVFVPHVEVFDAELFGVMRTEALTMDPQQRLLLHAVHEALSDGAGGPAAAFGRGVGTFVGIAGELVGESNDVTSMAALEMQEALSVQHMSSHSTR